MRVRHPDLEAAVANCPATGRRFTDYSTPTHHHRIRNHLQFRLSGFTVDWYQRPAFHSLRMKKAFALNDTFAETSQVFVRNVNPRRRKAAEQIVRDLCWLMSLGSGSEVLCYSFRYGAHAHTWSVSGLMQEFRSPIDMREGVELEAFIHASWSGYRRHWRRRQLNVVAHYLSLACAEALPLEAKLVLVFVAMENLKSTWARQRGIRFVRGRFVRSGGAPYPFESLVQDMLGEVKLRPALRRLVRLRNLMIHEGVTRGTTRSRVDRNFQLYGRAITILRRYVFRLAGYRGPMMDFVTMRTIGC